MFQPTRVEQKKTALIIARAEREAKKPKVAVDVTARSLIQLWDPRGSWSPEYNATILYFLFFFNVLKVYVRFVISLGFCDWISRATADFFVFISFLWFAERTAPDLRWRLYRETKTPGDHIGGKKRYLWDPLQHLPSYQNKIKTGFPGYQRRYSKTIPRPIERCWNRTRQKKIIIKLLK